MTAGGAQSLARLRTAWAGLQARERRLVLLAGTVVALAVLWWLAIAPPLATLKTAAAERAALRMELAQMQALAQEARALQALPTLSHDEARRALEQATTQHLAGSATLSVLGEQAQVQIDGAAADALAQWLAAVRSNARAIPIQANLKSAAADADGPVRWSGALTLVLPP